MYLQQQAASDRRAPSQFVRELLQIREWIRTNTDQSDLKHLVKFERIGRLCTLLGYGLAWLAPNPLSPFLISRGTTTRWMIGHQITHRGYDRVPGLPARYHSRHFARGIRRFFEWFDWTHPDAWRLEHVYMHHVRTGEREDPAFVERTMRYVRRMNTPQWFRYFVTFLNAATWKWSFYAPQSYMFVQNARTGNHKFRSFYTLLSPFNARGFEFWTVCFLPYFLFQFVAIPMLFSIISTKAAVFVLINTLAAEVLTNLETFVIIAPNHTGADLRNFTDPAHGKAEYFVRQVLSTANYRGGNDFKDYMFYFVNYQTEHHIWPDVPLLKYQQVHDRLRAICGSYGVPYTEEALRQRLKKTLDVIVGKASSRSCDSKNLHSEFGLS